MVYDELISVIVPAYNAEEYIENCVDSILSQVYDNIEVIIIDDGSTDNTREVCRKYDNDNRVTFIATENGGPGKARNNGIDNAKGEWILFVDSDDTIDKEMCSRLYKAAEDADADIALCNLKNITVDNKETHIIPFKNDRVVFKDDKLKKLEYDLICKQSETGKSMIALSGPVCKLIKRSLIGDTRFPLEMDLGEDTCFVLCLLEKSRSLVYIKDVLYNRFLRSDSLSNGNSNEDVRLHKYTNWIYNKYADSSRFRDAAVMLCAKNLFRIIMIYINDVDFSGVSKNTSRIKNYISNTDYHLLFKDIYKINLPFSSKIVLLLAKINFYHMIWFLFRMKASTRKKEL